MTAQSDNRNEPKPGCTFYIAGFNFDSTSSGQWRIDGQGRTEGEARLSGTWGPSDTDGDWRTSVLTIPEGGHYKAAAWQTLPNNPPGGEKTKVFKIECGQQSGGGAGGQASEEIKAAIDS